MATPNYRCSQDELYSGCRIVNRAAQRELAQLGAYKPKYNAVFFSDLEAQIAAAEALPNLQNRAGAVETKRIALTQKARTCLNQWQFLKGYIESTPDFQGSYYKPAIEAAGSLYYDPASGNDWESVSALMQAGETFINQQSAALSAGNNMPPTFLPQFVAAKNDFANELIGFQDEELLVRQATQAKIEANNAIYKEVMQLCKDGAKIFRDDEAKRQQFIWEDVLYLVRGAGIAGVRGTVTNTSTGLPVAGATITLVPGFETGLTDAEGNYRITGVAAGNYALKATASGFNEAEQPVTIPTGTVTAVDITLTPQ